MNQASRKNNTTLVAPFIVTVAAVFAYLFMSGNMPDMTGKKTQPENGVPYGGELVEYSASAPISANAPVSAAGAYYMDGQPIYRFRDTKRWPVASITKLMTALVAHRLLPPDEYVPITRKAIETEGAAGGFSAGEAVSVEDLIEAMLTVSSNDAASAIAEYVGEEKFISEMNRVASEIGMSQTTFRDPTGLSTRNLSTVADIARLAQYLWMHEPDILKVSSAENVSIVDRNTGAERQLTSINKFAGRRDFIGGKTGQIPEADGNLVSIFRIPGEDMPVVIVVFGAGDRFQETEQILKDI